jgi:long-chain acyl-CoA synthetase
VNEQLGPGRLAPRLAPPLPAVAPDVSRLLRDAARDLPDHEALVCDQRRWTYAQLDAIVNRGARALRELGIRAGDRVACSLPNCPEIAIAFLSAMRVGAIWVGVNRVLAPPEKRAILQDCDAELFMSDRAGIDALRAGSAPTCRVVVAAGEAESWMMLAESMAADPLDHVLDPQGPAAIAYTSGTTGEPKGAVHSQRNLIFLAVGQRELGRIFDGARIGVVLPLTLLNFQALAVVAAAFVRGTCVIVRHANAEELASTIHRERIQVFSGVPTLIHDLLNDPAISREHLESLRFVAVGGAEMPDDFRRRFEDQFGFGLAHSYGLTETLNGCVSEVPGEAHRPGTCGRAYPTLEASIRDQAGALLPAGHDGELWIGPRTSGPFAGLYTPMLGYWNRPLETDEVLRDGMLRTGDIAHMDDDGYVYIQGRRNEMIIRGGANVYPADVEAALRRHPAVHDAAVVGVDDDRLGQRVVAFVEAVSGGAPSDADELLEHCRANLAFYKVPSEIILCEMPRNVMGKVQKHRLSAVFAD